jgi:catalase
MASENSKSGADGKFADMAKDTVDAHAKQHMTTDYGIKISDPDHWLKVADEKRTGPSLLEDQIAREKVRSSDQSNPTNLTRSDYALRP